MELPDGMPKPKPKAYKPGPQPMLMATVAASARANKMGTLSVSWSAKSAPGEEPPRVKAQWADQDQLASRAKYWGRSLVALGIMFFIVAASYDMSTRIADKAPARVRDSGMVTLRTPAKAILGQEVADETFALPPVRTSKHKSEWLARKFPDGEGLNTQESLCFCTLQDRGRDCGVSTPRLVVWGRGYQWGFFSLFYASLCAIGEFGPKTVIDFTSSPGGENLYQAARGDNSWEYAFEQPANVSVMEAELAACSADVEDPHALCVVRPYEEVNHGDMGCSKAGDKRCCVLHGDAERATARDKLAFQRLPFLRDCRDKMGYPNREMTPEQLAKARAVARQHVRVKPAVSAQFERLRQEMLAPAAVTIGIHKRETDKQLECEQVPSELFYATVDAILANNTGKRAAIFLATDSAAAVAAFTARYGDRVVYRKTALRSAGAQAVHLDVDNRESAGAQKVADVVLDAMLLGACEYLIRTGSGVSMAAQVLSERAQQVTYLRAPGGHC